MTWKYEVEWLDASGNSHCNTFWDEESAWNFYELLCENDDYQCKMPDMVKATQA